MKWLLCLAILLNSIGCNMTNLPWISPVDRARYPNGVLDRLDQHDAGIQQQQQLNVAGSSLTEFSNDAWSTSTSYPSISNGRLTLTSGTPVTNAGVSGNTLYFTPFIGNLIGMYNGSTWDQIPFQELSIPALTAVSGTTTNGLATITGLADTSQLIVGMFVSGTGIPTTSQALIQSIDSATQITMNVNATASATVTVTFRLAPGCLFDVFMVDTGAGVLALRFVAWNQPALGTITSITNATPPVVTSTAHGLQPGQAVRIANSAGFASGAPTVARVGTVAANTFQLLGFDGTNLPASGAGTGGTWQNMRLPGGTRATALSLQDGTYVLSTNTTWRYLGTIRTLTGDTTTLADGSANRFVWNYYNRRLRGLQSAISTATWNVAVINTWQPAHNDITNVNEFCIGVLEDEIYARRTVDLTIVSSVNGRTGVTFDTFVISGGSAPVLLRLNQNNNASAIVSTITTELYAVLQGAIAVPGYHFAAAQEQANSTTNVTFRGNGEESLEGWIWG